MKSVMQRRENYLFALISLVVLLSSCAHLNKKNQQETEERLSFLSKKGIASGNTQTRDLSLFIKQWNIEINEIGAIYDEETNILTISGFDVDNKGKFYFAANNPVIVSCFDGHRKSWSKETNKKQSKFGLFSWYDNNLYFIDEQENSILQIPDDGHDSIMSYKLPTMKIEGGSFIEGECVLLDSISVEEKGERYCNIWRIAIPNRVISKKRSMGVYDSWYSWVTSDNDTILIPDIGKEIEEGGSLYVRKGEIGRNIIFSTFREYGEGTIAVKSSIKDSLHFYTIPRLPSFNVYASSLGDDLIINPDYDVFRKGKLYLLGYDKSPKTIVVTEIDIEGFINAAIEKNNQDTNI